VDEALCLLVGCTASSVSVSVRRDHLLTDPGHS
jgi:hypothetical protein